MADVDWNEQATWSRAAEHHEAGLGEPDPDDTGEDRTGPLGELVRDFVACPLEQRVAIRITRANGLPIDDAEIAELSRQADFPFKDG